MPGAVRSDAERAAPLHRNSLKFGLIEEIEMRYAWLLGVVASLIPMIGDAAQREANTEVAALYTYTQFGGGDVQVLVTNPVTGCSGGFWLKSSDPGFKTTYSVLLSAYHTHSQLRIGGEDADLWTGSNAPHCRIVYVGILSS